MTHHRGIACAAMLASLACSGSRNMALSASADSARLIDSEWHLVDLHQQPAPLGAGDRAVSMRLSGADARVSGFGGCNRYAGTYTLRGDSLRFGPVMMTRMACTTGNDLEVRYAGALESVRRFRFAGPHLELLAGDSIIARYRPVTASP